MNYDLVIAYGLLNQAASDIDDLTPQINRIQNAIKNDAGGSSDAVPGLLNADNTDLGPTNDLHNMLGWWYTQWAAPIQNAMSGLTSLGALFKGAADAFAESDMAQASGINLGELMTQVLNYPHLMDNYNNAWGYKLTENPYTHQFPDMPDPVMPTPVQDPYSYMGNLQDYGPQTTFTYQPGYDPNVPADQKASSWPSRLLASETTTVSYDGMTYTETTNFGPDKGWGNGGPVQDTTQVVTNVDGSTDVVATNLDPGSGGGVLTDISNNGITISVRGGWKDSWWQLPTSSPSQTQQPPPYVPPRDNGPT